MRRTRLGVHDVMGPIARLALIMGKDDGLSRTTDILMITHNRPQYTKRSLGQLLDSCDDLSRVWVWHNGNDHETLDVVYSFRGHPKLYKFHHSVVNVKLNEPTNWLWGGGAGDLVGKVDDDCIVPDGWIEVLRQAHELNPSLGVVGCWHFREGDIGESDICERVFSLKGHQIFKNCWIGGSGYLMKRECIKRQGLLRRNQNFSNYCIRLAARGWINGWYHPFLYQDHMDDPRSPFTALRTDEDVLTKVGLTAKRRGIKTVQDLLERQQVGLREILESSLDPRDHIGLRPKLARLVFRLNRLLGNRPA